MNSIRVSDSEYITLATTAAIGRLQIEDLVGAACREFARKDETLQEYWLRKVWFGPPTALEAPPAGRRPGGMLNALARRLFSARG
jgi:hypothetical protein